MTFCRSIQSFFICALLLSGQTNVAYSAATLAAVPIAMSAAARKALGPLAPNRIAAIALSSTATLLIKDANRRIRGHGSGFVVRPGVIATNHHVFRGGATGLAKFPGQDKEYPIASILMVDAEHDLALLSVPGITAPSMKLGDADKVAVGDTVYALGTPITQSLEGTFTRGTISAMRDGGTLIQTDTAVSPGNSGGPLLNQKAKVIGVIVSAAQDGQNLNFAVNVRHLANLLQKFDAMGA